MRGLDRDDALEIAVTAGMVVGPGNLAGLAIVGTQATRVRLAVFSLVKKMGGTHSLDAPKPHSHVLMIARRQQPAAFLVKAIDGGAVSPREARPAIDAEEPQLVEPGPADLRQEGIVALPIRLDELW